MKAVVSGLINIETTLRVDKFPVEYCPVLYPFFGVKSTVSGVGYNVAKALTVLGADAPLLSLIGNDAGGRATQDELSIAGVPHRGVLAVMEETPQSVIIYDGDGRRQINVDLKDIQDRHYPADVFAAEAKGADIAILCNINFSRNLLPLAHAAGMRIATDIHVAHDPHDSYNRDFYAHADILFMSNEALKGREAEYVRTVAGVYARPEIIVMGMGAEGALLYRRGGEALVHVPAVRTREIINTIGAGDALFSAFVFNFARGLDAVEALRRAVVFASWKIGEKGAADGFLDAASLERLYAEHAAATAPRTH